MRALLAVALVAACTPEIGSGTYMCGPNASCPEDLACNGPDNLCVLPTTVEAFECTPEINTEPDDSAMLAYPITGLGCVAVPFKSSTCMLQGDSEDWVKFTAPTGCASVSLNARVSFTLAFERLAMELWDLDTNTQLSVDTKCPTSAEAGQELRCIIEPLTAGKNYGIRVLPAGDGNCDGDCSYNRYTLRVQVGS